MLAKNQTVTLTCENLGADLEGVCHYERQAVFVPGALPNEIFSAKIVQARPQYAFARIENLLRISPERREPFCPVYVHCGGCSCQHMTYEETLRAKRQQVFDCLTRIGGLALRSADVPPVLGATNPKGYRNKTSLPVGGTSDNIQLGFYKRRSHDIVSIDDCPISLGNISEVIATVKRWMAEYAVEPYQELTHNGLVRHVIVRTVRGGALMVLLVATSTDIPHVDALIELLRSAVPGFTSLHVSENRMHNNVILGKTCLKLYGDDAIFETLLGLTFEITPLSFFQVNPAQTEVLYQTALDYAALTPSDIVVDAYAGAGTISLCLAKRCKQVIGLEIVPQAVESARRNAQSNGIENVTFHTAAVEEKLPELVAQGLRPDVVVLDPPRKGVEPPVIEAILNAAPRRVVYISCHVPTQARDVAMLIAGGYRFASCQPVDLFCYASGVENVLCLVRE